MLYRVDTNDGWPLFIKSDYPERWTLDILSYMYRDSSVALLECCTEEDLFDVAVNLSDQSPLSVLELYQRYSFLPLILACDVCEVYERLDLDLPHRKKLKRFIEHCLQL